MASEKIPKRKLATSSLRDAIDAMIDNYKIRGKYDENRLISSWEEMMGKPIARRTERIFIKEKILFVKLNSAPLRQELTMSKVKVLDIIHQHFSRELVEEIKFY